MGGLAFKTELLFQKTKVAQIDGDDGFFACTSCHGPAT